jgi:hypothetical protein
MISPRDMEVCHTNLIETEQLRMRQYSKSSAGEQDVEGYS